MGQHKKDIQFRRENSAMVRHVLEFGHQIDWQGIKCLEKKNTQKDFRRVSYKRE